MLQLHSKFPDPTMLVNGVHIIHKDYSSTPDLKKTMNNSNELANGTPANNSNSPNFHHVLELNAKNLKWKKLLMF